MKTELKITLFRAAALAALLAVAWMLSGCVSVYGHAAGKAWGHPYLATRLAAAYAPQAPLIYAELPFEFVGDSVFLPLDLIVMPFVEDFN